MGIATLFERKTSPQLRRDALWEKKISHYVRPDSDYPIRVDVYISMVLKYQNTWLILFVDVMILCLFIFLKLMQ